MSKATPSGVAKSIRGLGRAVGRAESTVRKWLTRDDWPPRFGQVPPWNVAEVKAWMDAQLKPDPAASYRKRQAAAAAGIGECARMDALTRARIQTTIERALYIRQRRLKEAGELHDVRACEQRRQRQIHEVRSALLALGRSLANLLVGQDREAIEKIIDTECRAICETFARE